MWGKKTKIKKKNSVESLGHEQSYSVHLDWPIVYTHIHTRLDIYVYVHYVCANPICFSKIFENLLQTS